MTLEQWQSAEIDKLTAAIVRAQAQLKPVPKKCTNPFYNSKYADLADVMEGVAPFNAEGIAITQFPMEAPSGQLYLDTQLSLGNQWMRSRLTMTLAKNDPQGMGSAITYGRRYALGCMTGIVTDEDNDGNQPAQPSKPAYKPKPAVAPAQSPVGGASEVAQPPVALDAPIIWNAGDPPPKGHRGKDVRDIPEHYLVWYEKNGPQDDYRIKATFELDRRDAAKKMAEEANG
jgi:hypothetical protein